MNVFIFLILNLFLVLTPKAVLLTASVLTVIVFVINGFQRTAIRKAETGEDDKGKIFKKGQENPEDNDNGADKAAKEKEAALKKIVKDSEGIKMQGLEMGITIVGVISIAIGLLMTFMLDVVSDMPYYLLCILDAVVFMICFRFTLLNYNRVATRRLPQFDRKGGDDRA